MHQDDSTMSISLDALDILLTQVIADACNWVSFNLINMHSYVSACVCGQGSADVQV